jgi:hypothetical protein
MSGLNDVRTSGPVQPPRAKAKKMRLRFRMTAMNVRFFIIGVAGEVRPKYSAADKVPPSRGGWVLMR